MAVRLVVFDLDGTLIRGRTICEVVADGLGHRDRMRILEGARSRPETIAAREEMAGWYQDVPAETLRALSLDADLAPGALEGCELLRDCGVDLAIASMTWSFGVEAMAEMLDIERCLGTTFHADGRIDHVFAEDKASWIEGLGVPHDEIAGVGDSARDLPMLDVVGLPIFVGTERIDGLPPRTVHLPDADILEVARVVLA
jgi:HAD superfamily phosphoserine phosphatase-like hydrolase